MLARISIVDLIEFAASFKISLASTLVDIELSQFSGFVCVFDCGLRFVIDGVEQQSVMQEAEWAQRLGAAEGQGLSE